MSGNKCITCKQQQCKQDQEYGSLEKCPVQHIIILPPCSANDIGGIELDLLKCLRRSLKLLTGRIFLQSGDLKPERIAVFQYGGRCFQFIEFLRQFFRRCGHHQIQCVTAVQHISELQFHPVKFSGPVGEIAQNKSALDQQKCRQPQQADHGKNTAECSGIGRFLAS